MSPLLKAVSKLLFNKKHFNELNLELTLPSLSVQVQGKDFVGTNLKLIILIKTYHFCFYTEFFFRICQAASVDQWPAGAFVFQLPGETDS